MVFHDSSASATSRGKGILQSTRTIKIPQIPSGTRSVDSHRSRTANGHGKAPQKGGLAYTVWWARVPNPAPRCTRDGWWLYP